MRASDVRRHLSTSPVGKPVRINLGAGDTPRTLRNYFLVIAKNEGYQITTKQAVDHVVLTVHGYDESTAKSKTKKHTSGTWARTHNPNDFNWPVLELSKLASYPPELLFRIDMTPRPIAGQHTKPTGFNRGNSNGFKRKRKEEQW